MNWITDKFKRIKPKIKNLFRVKIGPEGKLWENCSCGAVLYKQDLKEKNKSQKGGNYSNYYIALYSL